jgi:hypothetical protein
MLIYHHPLEGMMALTGDIFSWGSILDTYRIKK